MTPMLIFVFSFLSVWLSLQLVFQRKQRASKRLQAIKEGPIQATLDRDMIDLEGSLLRRLAAPLWKVAVVASDKWTPTGWKNQEQKRLLQSGLSKLGLGEWLAWRLIALVVGAALGFIGALGQQGIMTFAVIGAGIGLGWYYPLVYVKQKATKRQKEMTKSLPDVLDLLTVSVEAGLGFDAGMAKVVEKTKGPLAEEFSKTLQEVRLGKGRRDALRDMGRRTSNPDVVGFVSAIVQADQLGVSIGNVLRIQSEDLRQRRRTRAEEQAMKAPIKILFPLVLFIFPSIFVIILGPAVINLIDVFLK